jgi:hypothetical protein
MTSDDWVPGRTDGKLVMVSIDKLDTLTRERDEARARLDNWKARGGPYAGLLVERDEWEQKTLTAMAAANALEADAQRWHDRFRAAEQDAARLGALLAEIDAAEYCDVYRNDYWSDVRAALAAHEARVKGGAP